MEYAENVFPYSEFPQEKELKGLILPYFAVHFGYE